jgi:hypothetical protein
MVRKKSDPILAGTWLPFADLFCHFESVTDITRGILGLITDLVFGMLKILAVPSYKYAHVPARKIHTEEAQHASTCLLRRRVRYFIPFVGVHRRSESRSPEPHAQRSCTGRWRIRFLGSALRDCSNASTSSSSTFSSLRLVLLLVSAARFGIVKHAEVLIVAVVFFTRLFRSA